MLFDLGPHFPSLPRRGVLGDTTSALHNRLYRTNTGLGMVFLFVSLNICLVENEPNQRHIGWDARGKNNILTILESNIRRAAGEV